MKQPALTIPTHVELAEPACRVLHNGVRLYTLAAPEFEVVRVSFVFRAGSAHQQKSFVASSTANLLCEGTESLSAQQIAERLDFYGSYFDVNIDRDSVYISFCALAKYFTQTMEVAEQLLLHPTFPEDELVAYRQKRKQRLSIERMKVETQAREAFATALFGREHPYGVVAPEEDYDHLTRADLVAFYTRCYTASRCFVVCSGLMNASVIDAVSHIAEQLPNRAEETLLHFPTPLTTHSVRVAHPGAVQASIRIGRLLFTRQHPDYVGMQVVAMLLGGYFGSRLMQNLRERHGYTYGVVSAMVNMEQGGYLAIATQVAYDKREQALSEIYHEIELLHTTLVDEQELAVVRSMMIGEVMRILDGPFGIADVTIENLMCGRGNSSVSDSLRQIREITPQQLRTLVRRYLQREDLVTVMTA